MPDLLDHQRSGIEFLKEHDRAALFDEPGLGKSRVMLEAATEPLIVVAPAMVLDSGTWDDEIEKWAPGIDATQVSYSSLAQRGKNGRVTRNSIGWPTDPPKEQFRRRWGTKIGDEAHYIKGRKTGWTKAFADLESDRTTLATGTPLPNWAQEAFTLLREIWPEKAKPGRELGSYWRWAKEWFDVGPGVWSPMEVKDPLDGSERGWDRFREENWGDRYILRLRRECLDLPPLLWSGEKRPGDEHELFRVKMGREQRKAYNELKRDFVTWLEDGTEVAAWSSAGQVTKLAKAATGLEVLQRGAGASAKLSALEELLDGRPLPTLVVAHFRDSVEACARSAVRVGMEAKVVHGGVNRGDRREAIRAFQSGSLPVLCASIDTISEGMTLHQGGADQCIRVERSALPSRNEQVIRRLHRMGVQVPIIGTDLVTEGTWDESLLELLKEKTDQQMKALLPKDLRALAR